MAGFSGVQHLNAVVWEVGDLCNTLLLDGPVVGVMGYHCHFYFTSAGCMNRHYVVDGAHLALQQPGGRRC